MSEPDWELLARRGYALLANTDRLSSWAWNKQSQAYVAAFELLVYGTVDGAPYAVTSDAIMDGESS